MPLTPTTRATANNATDNDVANSTSVVTASFTPSDNSLLVALAGAQNSPSGLSNLAIVGGGLTWTSRAQDTNATAQDFTSRVWTAPVTTGASMTVTVSNAAFWVSCVVIEFVGYDTVTPTGVTLVAHTGSRSGAYSPALSGTSAADSYVVAGGYADSGTATKGDAWNEIYDFNSASGGTSGQGNVESRFSAISAANWAAMTSSFSTSATGVEIKAAAPVGISVWLVTA